MKARELLPHYSAREALARDALGQAQDAAALAHHEAVRRESQYDDSIRKAVEKGIPAHDLIPACFNDTPSHQARVEAAAAKLQACREASDLAREGREEVEAEYATADMLLRECPEAAWRQEKHAEAEAHRAQVD